MHGANLFVRCATMALCTGLASGLPAGAGAQTKPLAGLDRYIEKTRADWNNVGAAVAVVQGTDVIYAHGFGVREIGKTPRVDAGTLFQVGSTTKAFTASALGLLVDEGKLHWDDPVIDYLPGFQLQDPWLTQHLTIRDIVAHRSGIADTPYYLLGIMDADAAVRQLRYVTPEAPFRDSYQYSNLLYGVAGKVIEAASGVSWHDFVRRRLLQPLKMTRSGTTAYDFWDSQYVAPTFLGSAPAGRPSLTDARDTNVAMPHGRDETGAVVVLPWQSFDNAAAAGTIVSSALDMATWLILHINEGRFEGQQLLKQETMQELHVTQNLHGRGQFPVGEMTQGYAMAWRKAEYRGDVVLAHSGGIVGFPARVALLPSRKIGVVVLSNGPNVPGDYTLGFLFHKAIAFWVFDRLLGAPQHDWSAEFLSQAQRVERETEQKKDQLRRSRRPNMPPSLPLERYAGAYEDQSKHSGPVNVRLQEGRLILSFIGRGAYSAGLEHWHQDLFRLRPNVGVAAGRGYAEPQFVAFSIDPTARVVSMSAFGGTFQRLPAPHDNQDGT